MPDLVTRPHLLAVDLIVAASVIVVAGMPVWVAGPLMGASAVLVLAAPAAGDRARDVRRLDLALVLFLACIALQLVSLPDVWRERLSPHQTGFYESFLLDYSRAAQEGQVPTTLSVSPVATVFSFGVIMSSILMFWACRRIFALGGTRHVVRTVAWLGLAVSLVGIVQRATAPGLLYWTWNPPGGGSPFGPFVNHNHFATWAVMAVPLVVGYWFARAGTHGNGQRPSRVALADALTRSGVTGIWLVAAATLLVVAVFVAGSRSALVSLGIAGAFWLWLTRRHLDSRRFIRLAAFGVVLALAIVTYAQISVTWERFARAAQEQSDEWGRLAIWRETLPIAQDFWVTGTGLGTYPTAMLVYQQSDRTYFFNQAHNHYLQLLAEGGLLLAVPALLVLVAFFRLAGRRLAADTTGHFWIRSGAAAGLCAVASQSVWETGLRMPANALLAAVLAAMAVHEPKQLVAHRRSAVS